MALLFTTDPAIEAQHLVELADNRGLQPAENVVPVLRRATADRYGPGLLAALDAVSARLSTAALPGWTPRWSWTAATRARWPERWLRDQGLSRVGGVVSDATAPMPAVRRTRRQRRPTGAPPPLPRRIGPSTTAWLVLAAILVTRRVRSLGAHALAAGRRPASTWLLRQLAAVRTPWLTDLANWINATA